jgi:hypothetical protein
MELRELAPGLWRWTARHPEWEDDAEAGSPADWPPDVGCVASLAADEGLVLIDPLVPEGEWDALDDLARDRHVAVLMTLRWHHRSVDDAVARYGAAVAPPAGVEPLVLERSDETMFWLPQHRALVPGDRLLGDGAGGLRLCPESWLRYLESGVTLADVRRELEPLLALPIELVLVSHGEPVLSGGRDALERALEA